MKNSSLAVLRHTTVMYFSSGTPPRVPCLICLRLLPAWRSGNKGTMLRVFLIPPCSLSSASQINQLETLSSLESPSLVGEESRQSHSTQGQSSLSLFPESPAVADSTVCQVESPVQIALWLGSFDAKRTDTGIHLRQQDKVCGHTHPVERWGLEIKHSFISSPKCVSVLNSDPRYMNTCDRIATLITNKRF